MSSVISIMFIVSLLAAVGLVLTLDGSDSVGQITRPYTASCTWIHPDSFRCDTEEFGCPGPEGKYKAKTYSFRQETPICCCLPQW